MTTGDRLSATGGGNVLSGRVGGFAVQSGAVHGDVRISLPPTTLTAIYAAPRELPVAPALWVDRADQLAALDQLLSCGQEPPDRPLVIVITGPGGVGKSALALHWLHRHCDRFEGELYANLRGHTPGGHPATPAEILGRFLRAFGVPAERIPAELDELTALFRSVMADRRMLIMVDDAAAAGQVRPLLAPGAGMVVVTTRHRRLAGLVDVGARYIEVGPFDGDAAVALLSRIAGAGRVGQETQAARALTGLCGGLPLAVVICGARLARRRHLPLARLADELGDTRRRLALLTIPHEEDLNMLTSIDSSYNALTVPQQNLFVALGWHPGPQFSSELAAAAAGIDTDTAAELLEELAAANLIQELPSGRYRFHDLLRLYARTKSAAHPRDTPDARNAQDSGDGEDEGGGKVFGRIADYYLRMVVEVDLIVLHARPQLGPMYSTVRAAPQRSFASKAEALAWLDDELPNVHGVIREAHHQGMFDVAWQIVEGLWGYFVNRKRYADWMATHEIGLAAARAVADVRAEQKMLTGLAQAFSNLHRFAQAAELFEQALSLSERADYPVGEAAALSGLGTAAQCLGRIEEAIGYFERAQAIHRRQARPRGIAMTNRHIGEAHRQAGQMNNDPARFDQAIFYLTRALETFRQLPDEPYNQGRILCALGETHLLAGRPDAALDSLNRALALAAGEAPHMEASARMLLADVLQATGNPSAAAEHLTTAAHIFTELGAPEAELVRQRLAQLTPHGDESSPSWPSPDRLARGRADLPQLDSVDEG